MGNRVLVRPRGRQRSARLEALEARTLMAATPDFVRESLTNPVTGNTYHLLAPTTWDNAEAQSIQLGGHLVVVNDAAEQEFLWSTFGPITGLFWIGINDVATEGSFIWTTGEPPAYTNWFEGEPNNWYPVGEDWGNMWIDYGSQWNDLGPQSDQPPLQYAVAEVRNAPDLFATLGDAPASLQPGQSFSLSATLTNLGSIPATGPVDISYYLSADGSIDSSDALIATVAGPAGELPFNTRVALAAQEIPLAAGLKPGTYRVLVRVDVRDAMAEADEVNNVVSTRPFDVGAVFVPVTRTVSGVVRDGEDLPLHGVQLRAGEFSAFTDYDGKKSKIDRDGVTGDYDLPAILVGHNVTFAGEFGRFVPADAATSKIAVTAQDLGGATFTKEVGLDQLITYDGTLPNGGMPVGRASLRPIYLNDYSARDLAGTLRLHRDLRNDRNSDRISTKPVKAVGRSGRYAREVEVVTERLSTLGFMESAEVPLATAPALAKRSPAERALRLFKDIWFGPPPGGAGKAAKSKTAVTVDAPTLAALNASNPGAGRVWTNEPPAKWTFAAGAEDIWMHRSAFNALRDVAAASSVSGFILTKASPAAGGAGASHRVGAQVDFRWVDSAGTGQIAGSFWEPVEGFGRADVTLVGDRRLAMPDPTELGVRWRYVAAYDQAKTMETIKALLAAGATDIRFNDPAILLELGAISIAPGANPKLTILRSDVRPEAGYDAHIRVGFPFAP